MFGNTLISFLLLLTSTVAQTAPGFPITALQTLNVSFGSDNVSPPGKLIPRAETANPPTIYTPAFTSAGKAVLFLVDADVPRNGTRVQLLHWLVSNVTLASQNSSLLSIPSTAEAPYLQPSPPVGDIPHNYNALLFPQPANFTVPSQFTQLLQTRSPFNITAFVAAAGLQAPLAANYFQVQNLTGVTGTATTFPPARPTSTPTSSANATVVPYQGTGSTMVEGGKMFWVGVGSAIIAGVAAFVL